MTGMSKRFGPNQRPHRVTATIVFIIYVEH